MQGIGGEFTPKRDDGNSAIHHFKGKVFKLGRIHFLDGKKCKNDASTQLSFWFLEESSTAQFNAHQCLEK